jgi:hypothetical protein
MPHCALVAPTEKPRGNLVHRIINSFRVLAGGQRARMRIEEIFGWLKTVALLPKTRHRGTARVDWMFVFALAVYVRIRNLAAQSG